MQLRRAIGVVMLVVGAATHAAATQVSASGSVVDMAGVLDVDTMLQLDSAVANYASATGFTLAAITVDDLADEILQDYARASLQAYVASKSDVNARVALLMWSSSEQFAIAVSPAFGHELSPDEVARVIREQVLPQMRAGAVGAGLLHGVYGLMVAAGEPSDEPANPQEMIMLARWDGSAEPAAPDAGHEPDLVVPRAGSDVNALLRAFGDNPGAALAASWDRSREQWAALQDRLVRMSAELRSGGSGNAMAFVIAGLVLLAALAGVWRMTRSVVAPAVLAGFAAAVLCWGLTGYIELTVLLALSGALLGIGLRLLKTLAARDHQARLQPSPYSPMNRMPSPRPAAVAPPARTPPPPTPATRTDGHARDAKRPGGDFGLALERAHRDGVRTPMVDHLIASKDRLKASMVARKKQRQIWMVAIVVSFFLLLPLALLLGVAWIVSELNHLKPPQVSLPDFVRQLIAELQAVARHQKPRA